MKSEAVPNRWLALVVLSLAQLTVILDSTIVNIALPTAQRDLGFSDDNRQWVVTGYSLAFGSLLLLGGRLCDLYGRKRLFIIGMIGFAAASALGGAADGFGLLLLARIAQGAFAAILATAALSMVSVTFAGYHFVFWIAAALFLGGALLSAALFRSGPLAVEPDAEPVPIH